VANSTGLRFFSGDDVRKALPMREAVEVMRRAFVQLSAGAAEAPPRTHVAVPRHAGNMLFMPAHLPAEGRLGVKVITLFDGNAARGLPRIQALVLLLDGTDGRPLAVIEGTSLTAIRTGAAAGVATDLLARQDAAVAAIFGAGVQGRTQLEAVCAVRPIRRALVFDPDRSRAAAFAGEMTGRLGIAVAVAESAAAAVREADVICTATTARTPVFADADLKAGVHINAIGSYQPAVQEIPAATICRAQVVVDHKESALAEAGDLLIPIGQGLFSADRVHAELGQIAAGLRPGRTAADAVTVFKSVGVAVQDLAAAMHVAARGEELGLGTAVRL
jgi:alanine dehydrogenase